MDTAIVEPRHAAGLLALFDAASRGCYCRFWHFGGDDNGWQMRCGQQAHDNRAELERALASGSDEARGVIACRGDAVIGWLKLCPAPALPKLSTRRLYRSLACFAGDRDGVLVAGCMLVHPDARRQGVARALVGAAVSAGRLWGARAIEAIPRRSAEPLRDDELWLGPIDLFLEHGFERIDGPEPYPVLRLAL